MAIFTWFDGEVPKCLKVTQVYGLIITTDGRMLLRTEDQKYYLAGGKPEPEDNDMESTLRRELLEEINVTIGKPYMVGYQLVDEENGTTPYAQVRMTALIEKIGPCKPDPDTGRTYGRLLTHPLMAAALLNWGDVGVSQINSAMKLAKKHFGIKQFSNESTIL